MRIRNLVELVLFTCVLLLATVSDAAAYLDPGTGSYIFQILLASILVALFYGKRIWRHLKAVAARVLAGFKWKRG